MTTPTSSYLQTLSPDEAGSFIASLQKVKDHLSRELEWMTQQVQQKTVQLQGIETLLAEAGTGGLITADALTTALTTTQAALSTTESIVPSVSDTASTLKESDRSATPNGNGSPQTDSVVEPSTSTAASPTAPMLASVTSPTKFGSSAKKASATLQPKGQSLTANKPKTAKPKKLPSSSKSPGKGSQFSNHKELRALLLPTFTGKTLTDVVAQILEAGDKPLHLDDLLAQMYGKLTDSDFKRAKVSLANVLSVGKKEGKWQNLGDGLYTIKK